MPATITLKSYKPSRALSRETEAFTATIYVNGKKAGDVRNDGGGGAHYYFFDKRDLEGEFYKAARAWNDINEPGSRSNDADSFVSSLCQELDMLKQAKRLVKPHPAGTGAIFVQKGAWISPEVTEEHVKTMSLEEIGVMKRQKQYIEDRSALPWYKVRYDYEGIYAVPVGTTPEAVAAKAGAQFWRVLI